MAAPAVAHLITNNDLSRRPIKALRAAAAIDLPKRLPRGLRAEIESAIKLHQDAVEGLLRILDRTDGDPDLEPSLGCHSYGVGLAGVDCEGGDIQDEPHDEADEGNSEPSLAHTNDMNQERATMHLGVVSVGSTWINSDEDFEADHDGREPSLGAPDGQIDQTDWAAGDGHDLEGDEHDGREPEGEL